MYLPLKRTRDLGSGGEQDCQISTQQQPRAVSARRHHDLIVGDFVISFPVQLFGAAGSSLAQVFAEIPVF